MGKAKSDVMAVHGIVCYRWASSPVPRTRNLTRFQCKALARCDHSVYTERTKLFTSRLETPVPAVNERNTFIERMGLAAETDGLSRIAGRVFAALLLESEPLSLDALADQLDVSKASISTEARRLLDRGVAERVTKPGDRRDYYVLAPDFFAQIVRFRLGRWSAFHRLVTEMQDSAADEPRSVRERFAYLDEFHDFILSRVEDALEEWRDRAQRPGTESRERVRSGRQRSTPKHGKRQLSRERLG